MPKFGRKKKFAPRHIPTPVIAPLPTPEPIPETKPAPILATPKPETKPDIISLVPQQEIKPAKREEKKVVFKKSLGDLKNEVKDKHSKEAITKFVMDNQHHIRNLSDQDKKHIVLHLKRKYK